MKRIYLIIATFSLSAFFSNAQTAVFNLPPKTLKKTKIELLYSHYTQDGDNSAVTGGIGTEELTVYAPKVKINTNFKKRNNLSFDVGVDIISSASTDNIDFVVSSASIIDARNFANIGYTRQLKKQDIELSVGTGYSFESDYLAVPVTAGFLFTEKNKMRSYAFKLQTSFDDLRWGRLHPDFKRPTRLIYPWELRNTDWFDVYHRNSYNFKIGFTQVINKRNIIGIYPEMSYQEGLLSTPFHRVYFDNNKLKVEKLPNQRRKGILAIKLNSFVGGRLILKNEINFYKDNFQISAIAIENSTTIKLDKPISISPFFRVYIQKGSPYFAPYKEHSIEDVYYTSDYDMSTFEAYKIGVNLRYAPQKFLNKRFLFEEMQIRYAFLYRTDGLKAHVVGISFSSTYFGKKKGDENQLIGH